MLDFCLKGSYFLTSRLDLSDLSNAFRSKPAQSTHRCIMEKTKLMNLNPFLPHYVEQSVEVTEMTDPTRLLFTVLMYLDSQFKQSGYNQFVSEHCLHKLHHCLDAIFFFLSKFLFIKNTDFAPFLSFTKCIFSNQLLFF